MVIETFLLAVADILKSLLTAYKWAIIIYTLLSWTHIRNEVTRVVEKISEPALNVIKSRINTVFHEVDFAPIILIVFIEFLNRFAVEMIYQLASIS